MNLKRLASTLAAAALAGGGAITMSAVTAAPAHADGGFGHHGHGHHGHFGSFGTHGFAGGARLCVARAHKKVLKKRGGGKFGKYFGKKRNFVVKKVATRYVKCGAWNRHHLNRFGHHKSHHKKFGHKGFGHKFHDWGHKGFGHKKGGWGW